MRISTGMLYQTGVRTIQDQTTQMLHTQQQVATGRRIVAPSDDPIASARALEISQAQSLNSTFQTNQGSAKDSLNLLENKLYAVEDIITHTRTRAVEAGNGSYSDSEWGAIAIDIRASFDSLLGLANSQNGNGEYMFSGYQADVKPYVGNINGVSFQGDQGQRTLQVSPSRIMSVSNSGSEVFNDVKAPQGEFFAVPGNPNGGTGYVASTQTTGTYTGTQYLVSWDGTNYNVTDRATGAAVTSQTGPTLSFGNVQLEMAGTPSVGDVFEVGPSADVFKMYTNLTRALENPSSNGVSGAISQAITGMDQSLDQVLTVHASVGSRMLEVNTLEDVGSDLDVQYADTLSRLQDVDYAQAVSDLSLQQTYLQASQQSFLKITNLSLFNYLG
ncbi:flagellar hook-associated protein 3 [Nitrogeniibacter mangrovi]|uniref:Flagellar hook-associated protein 3 n=1 Tax=Nitrogeniibacter mangrovi TaxID=2016596 RepID=A0A6C1B4L3_9RHOO|nr:flagellar hook-associated protein FlgL [Nitrogeniibacter mangrovi]QID18373.1 flagellar hook-associated protein 3 [Nitrogeniibacter mangrovi]